MRDNPTAPTVSQKNLYDISRKSQNFEEHFLYDVYDNKRLGKKHI